MDTMLFPERCGHWVRCAFVDGSLQAHLPHQIYQTPSLCNTSARSLQSKHFNHYQEEWQHLYHALPLAMTFAHHAYEGKLLAIGSGEGNLQVVHTSDEHTSADAGKRILTEASTHTYSITDLAFTPPTSAGRMDGDGSLLSASCDSYVAKFNLERQCIEWKLKAHVDWVKRVLYKPGNQNEFWTCGSDGIIKRWDERQLLKDCGKLEGDEFKIYEESLPLWDWRGLHIRFKEKKMRKILIRSKATSVAGLAFVRNDPPVLASCGASDGMVKLWDLRKITPKRPVPMVEFTATKSSADAAKRPGSSGFQSAPTRGRGISWMSSDQRAERLAIRTMEGIVLVYDCHSLVTKGFADASLHDGDKYKPIALMNDKDAGKRKMDFIYLPVLSGNGRFIALQTEMGKRLYVFDMWSDEPQTPLMQMECSEEGSELLDVISLAWGRFCNPDQWAIGSKGGTIRMFKLGVPSGSAAPLPNTAPSSMPFWSSYQVMINEYGNPISPEDLPINELLQHFDNNTIIIKPKSTFFDISDPSILLNSAKQSYEEMMAKLNMVHPTVEKIADTLCDDETSCGGEAFCEDWKPNLRHLPLSKDAPQLSRGDKETNVLEKAYTPLTHNCLYQPDAEHINTVVPWLRKEIIGAEDEPATPLTPPVSPLPAKGRDRTLNESLSPLHRKRPIRNAIPRYSEEEMDSELDECLNWLYREDEVTFPLSSRNHNYFETCSPSHLNKQTVQPPLIGNSSSYATAIGWDALANESSSQEGTSGPPFFSTPSQIDPYEMPSVSQQSPLHPSKTRRHPRLSTISNSPQSHKKNFEGTPHPTEPSTQPSFSPFTFAAHSPASSLTSFIAPQPVGIRGMHGVTGALPSFPSERHQTKDDTEKAACLRTQRLNMTETNQVKQLISASDVNHPQYLKGSEDCEVPFLNENSRGGTSPTILHSIQPQRQKRVLNSLGDKETMLAEADPENININCGSSDMLTRGGTNYPIKQKQHNEPTQQCTTSGGTRSSFKHSSSLDEVKGEVGEPSERRICTQILQNPPKPKNKWNKEKPTKQFILDGWVQVHRESAG